MFGFCSQISEKQINHRGLNFLSFVKGKITLALSSYFASTFKKPIVHYLF